MFPSKPNYVSQEVLINLIQFCSWQSAACLRSCQSAQPGPVMVSEASQLIWLRV